MPLYVPDSGFQSVPSSGLKPWVTKQADYTAEAGDRLFVDTSSSSWTLILPANPAAGDTVTLLALNDLSLNELFIGTQVFRFQGEEKLLRLRKRFGVYQLIYTNATVGWIEAPVGQFFITTPVVELEFSTIQDTNGLIYDLGTQRKTVAFSNPHLSNQVVQVQSLDSAIVDATTYGPEKLSDRSNTTGVFVNPGGNNWVSIDIGVGRLLVLKRYVLQSLNDGGNPRVLRNWKMQGSNNVGTNTPASIAAATWVDLDNHVSDATLGNTNSGSASFPVSNSTPFRWFRLLQTGGMSDNSNFFRLGDWEFYGSLTE